MTETPRTSFLLAVDDGGEYFVAAGSPLVLGHLSSVAADLPFLADVEGEHARLALTDSFHGGFRWTIASLAGSRGLAAGRFLGPEPTVLADGDLVQLAPNLEFRFRAPDASSASAVLDLLSGADCRGARHVLLFAPGRAGRVRIGSHATRHVAIPDLLRETSLEVEGSSLVVRCAGGVRVHGGVSPAGPDPALSLPCPPVQPISLALGARAPGRPPFGITISPARMVPSSPARPRPA